MNQRQIDALVMRLYRAHRYNQSAAARAVGVSQVSFWRYLHTPQNPAPDVLERMRALDIEIKAARDEARAAAASASTALVVVDTALARIDTRAADAAEVARAAHGIRGYAKRSSRTRSDYGAMAAGERDGARVNVNGGSGSLGAGQGQIS